MYRYYLTQRPPSIGTHPIENLLDIQESGFRNRSAYKLYYKEPLTVDQIKKYELTPDYQSNGVKEHTFTFAGQQVTETPVIGSENQIVTYVENEVFESYSFKGWFNRINGIEV